ncbi:uncharacterized protein ASCRUDRAFT_70776 [Ascoidea rubescens DSM 1968]|uniref:Uncharacterized protein n=1 Tax=Ascoidea rubescens DSM 1968 TaxID=1344418 RepID=A0A1D2VH98_9ASCO|nr:hypothetical protein ASCRUDRAFT_70776 [Ascoidea rubescens DSM 1968]ODV60930.1 hypothetical protein ASCRUDRAFT_70776 [Ascoidea rubescens DSM 1968]
MTDAAPPYNLYKVEFLGQGTQDHIAFLLEVAPNQFNIYDVSGSPAIGFAFHSADDFRCEDDFTYIEGSKQLIGSIDYSVDEFIEILKSVPPPPKQRLQDIRRGKILNCRNWFADAKREIEKYSK